MEGYEQLFACVRPLRHLLWSFREEIGEWPRESEARANPVDVEYMGLWGEQPDTLDVTRELNQFAEREDIEWDTGVFRKITCTPGDVTAYIGFELAEATRVELHGVRVTTGRLELTRPHEWVVEVQRFDGPRIEEMTARKGDHATDIAHLLRCWGMIRIDPEEDERVVWVSTPLLACTIHLEGEVVTEAGCMEIPGARATPKPEPKTEPEPEPKWYSGSQNIPGVPDISDPDYTGLDYDWDDYNPD